MSDAVPKKFSSYVNFAGVLLSIFVSIVGSTTAVIWYLEGRYSLTGAIVAFESKCPSGWEESSTATGRVLVGAGEGTNKSSSGRRLATYQLGETGGEEQHTISLDEMPNHSHGMQVLRELALPERGDFVLDRQIGNDKPDGTGELNGRRNKMQFTESVGGGKSFSVEPPYLAVIFCRRPR